MPTDTAVRTLRIVTFTADQRARYETWDALRRDVFARELGWSLPPREPGAALSDPFDRRATFLAAEIDGETIGILRAVRAADGFPHRDLLDEHVRQGGLDAHVSAIGTVNALAVVAPHRHARFVDAGTDASGTAATLLLEAAVRQLAATGVRVVLATVLSAISAHVFLRAGFALLDRPFLHPGDPRFRLANVGLVLPESGGAASLEPALRQAAAHFRRSHAAALAEGSIDELFAVRRARLAAGGHG
jgi:hypothetical protein